MWESSSTKLCVIFNASCKTRNGTSLNDHLFVGPKLQQDLLAIIARWRLCVYCRYRKNFSPDFDRTHGCWLPANTLTTDPWIFAAAFQISYRYGLASVSYLAIGVLKQLAIDDDPLFSAAVPIIESSIYVDDVHSSARIILTSCVK
jgi:hypothetical protein